MGYYTSFKFKVIEGDESLIKEFRKENENAKYAVDEYGDTNDSCKWYDCEKDIVSFSIKHPKIIFMLEGEGEESGDIWKLYVQDGHVQNCRAKIVFPEFDKAKLQADIRESKINKVIDGK